MSLVEVLVGMTIFAITAVIVVPTMMSKIHDARTSALSQTLFAFSLGVFEYKKAVTVFPGQLSLLTVKPLSTTTDACGLTQIGTKSNSWRGPYVTREVATTGLIIGTSTVQNTMRRVTAGSSVFLLIDIAAVDTAISNALEAELDGTGAPDANAGTIRWTSSAINYTAGVLSSSIPAATTGTVNLSYAIPMSGC